MAVEAVQSADQDNPATGTPLDNPMSATEADAAIAKLFGNLAPQDNPEETDEGDHEADADPIVENLETDNPDDDEEVPEAVDDDLPDEPEQQRDEKGRFVAEDALVKMGDEDVPVSELKNGYLRQRDYSTKTEELARDRDGLSQRQDSFLRELNVIREYALATMPQRPEPPQEPATVNPVAWAEYSQRKEEYENMVQWAHHIENSQNAAFEERSAKSREAAEKVQQAQIAKINDAFKLTDKGKQDAFWSNLGTRAAEAYGVPAEEVKKLTDFNVVRILRDALAYKASQSKVQQVKNGLSAKPQLVQGNGRRQSPDQVQARQRTARFQKLRETGSTHDADAAILDFLTKGS